MCPQINIFFTLYIKWTNKKSSRPNLHWKDGQTKARKDEQKKPEWNFTSKRHGKLFKYRDSSA